MSPSSLRANIAAEVQRGDQALLAADQLLRAGLFYDAASRAYYGAFHFVRALCLAAGEEPRSHSGVGHLLALHYVRSGILPPDTSRLFASLQKYRESADYDAAFVLDEPGALAAVSDARVLVERARERLRGAGLL